jgi:membrane protein DedA with SNARE-associated domain
MLADMMREVAAFAHAHQAWAPAVGGCLAFLKSIAVFSFFIPATGPLLALGALIGAGALPFVPIWLAVSLGAALGDWVSYELGRLGRDRVAAIWPFSRWPIALERGEAFFCRFGPIGIVLARYFGPLRATAPIAAGALGMAFLPFQLANGGGALLWAGSLLLPGAVGLETIASWLGWATK